MKFLLLYEILYVLLIIAICLRIVWDTRSVSKALAYLLLVIFVPILGAIFYFSFGINYRKHKIYHKKLTIDQSFRQRLEQIYPQIRAHLNSLDTAIIAPYEKSLRFLSNIEERLSIIPNEEVKVICNGENLFPELLDALRTAKHHIHIEYYIYENDHIGNAIKNILIEKVRAGVEVRFIYDDFGSQGIRKNIVKELLANGVPAFPFYKINFVKLANRMNYRNHRKLCIIDGRTGYIGGMNVALRYVKGTRKQEWRDTHMRLRGGAVYGIQRAFLVDWYFMARTLITDKVYYPVLSPQISNNCIAQVVTSSPVSPWPDIMQGYMRILLEAKKYVYMESPYFLPTEPILFAMRTARQAGVDIRLMLPARTDSKIIEWAGRSYVQAALEAGVMICFYCAGFNHSKLLVCDDSLCTCGSTNVDFRSFENNFEANVFFYDKEMALKMKEVFLTGRVHRAGQSRHFCAPSFPCPTMGIAHPTAFPTALNG